MHDSDFFYIFKITVTELRHFVAYLWDDARKISRIDNALFTGPSTQGGMEQTASYMSQGNYSPSQTAVGYIDAR